MLIDTPTPCGLSTELTWPKRALKQLILLPVASSLPAASEGQPLVGYRKYYMTNVHAGRHPITSISGLTTPCMVGVTRLGSTRARVVTWHTRTHQSVMNPASLSRCAMASSSCA